MHAHWERQLINLAGHTADPSTRPFFSYWAGDAALQTTYRQCAAVTRIRSKSFYIAAALLPEEKRSAVHALFTFRRTLDDIRGESSDHDRAAKLDYWRTVVKTSAVPANRQNHDSLASAWTDTLLRYHIPRRYALQLIDGVARDFSQTRYQTFDGLATYCYGVASTVGLMGMHILGFQNEDAIPYVIKMGVATQMTNILRNVGADYRNGRVYLPREDLLSHGISETDIELGNVTPRWRRLMKFQIERTRRLHAEAREGINFLDPPGKLAAATISVFSQGILDEIERNDYNVFDRRPALNVFEKARLISMLWMYLKIS